MLLEAHAESLRDEYDRSISTAWHTAVFTNAGSKIPPLKKLLQRGPDPTIVREGDDADVVAAKQMMATMMAATTATKIIYQ